MSEWKVVPTMVLLGALQALEESVDLVQHNYVNDWRKGMPTREGQLIAMFAGLVNHKDSIELLRKILAAPTPPVVLPPLPKSVENKMSDFAVACARGGHEERVDSANGLRREIEAYARAALAAYGTKEQIDVER